MNRAAIFLFVAHFLVFPVRPETTVVTDPFCTASEQARVFMSAGSLKMASLLERLARQSDPVRNGFLNSNRVDAIRREIERFPNGTAPVQLHIQLALDLLYSGQTREALRRFDGIESFATNKQEVLGTQFLMELRHLQAVSHLRLAEEENCLTNHNPHSCLFPISGNGVHQMQTGSRKAIEILERELKRTPKNAGGIWLLNLAYMTLGEHPHKVPEDWRIPPEAFRSEYALTAFRDIAPDLGLDLDNLAGGTIAEDFDGDGDLDLFMSDWAARGPLHYFNNNGDGSFSDRTMEAGLTGIVGGLHTVQGDYNNDGLPDILILRGAWLESQGQLPPSLLRNLGKGRFSDVTEEAGLLALHPGQAAAWFDYNGDGWLDLFMGYESTGTNQHPCRLYRNNRDGSFTECARESGLGLIGFVKGVAAGDFNNDRRPDLYLSLRNQPNILMRNDGAGEGTAWKFSDVTMAAGVAAPTNSFSTWFFDYDNDGWEDLFVCGYMLKSLGDVARDYVGLPHESERPRLYRNNRNGTFKDVTREAGLFRLVHGMGSNYGDFDNDGWVDFYIGTGDPNFENLMPNRAFRNAGGMRFQDVTTSARLGHLQKGHGVSFADFDQDGDLDIYHSVGGAYEGDRYPNSLFENPGSTNAWLLLKLEGTKANRVAIGSRIRVALLHNGGQERVLYRTVSTGSSFGANPLRQMIGLGNATAIKAVEVEWAGSGIVQHFTNLEKGKFYRVVEGEERPIELPYSPIPFRPSSALPHRHLSSK